MRCSAAIFGNPTKRNTWWRSKETNKPRSQQVRNREYAWKFSKYDIKFCSLRYFNAAGADAKGDLGESRPKEFT